MCLEIDEGAELPVVEYRPYEQHVVDMRAGAVRIVGDDDVPGLEPGAVVFLDGVADRFGHGAGKGQLGFADHRGRIADLGRTGQGCRKVVKVLQHRREGAGEQPLADVIEEVAEAVAEHRGVEAAAAIGRGKGGLIQVPQCRTVHVASVMTISPTPPTCALCPGMTRVVAKGSTISAGPAMRSPAPSA